MPKNIVVLSDGTGQDGGRGHDTNVYKLYRMLEDRTDDQVVFYDQGLGTDTQRVTGMAFGAGFDRNILQCYRFIFDNYKSGDRIFLFGFSRGAATVRSLASFIHYFGILPNARPELIEQAYRIYTHRRTSSDQQQEARAGYNPRKLLNRAIHRWNRARRYDLDDEQNGKSAEFVRLHPNQWATVEFLGVWDTVPALGLAAAPLANAVLDLVPALRHNFHNFQLRRSVKHACHALAIDDERKWFWPTVWKETQENLDRARITREAAELKRQIEETLELKEQAGQDVKQRKEIDGRLRRLRQQTEENNRRLRRAIEAGRQQKVEQVWFGGSHTDVGGGFWEAGFSDIALEWMLQKATAHGLKLYFGSREYWNFCIAPDPTDMFHDPRAGLGRIYPLQKRAQVWQEAFDTFGPPRIHESVLRRIEAFPIEANTDVSSNGQQPAAQEPGYDPCILHEYPDEQTMEAWFRAKYAEYAQPIEELYQSLTGNSHDAWSLRTFHALPQGPEAHAASLQAWQARPENSYRNVLSVDKLSYEQWKVENDYVLEEITFRGKRMKVLVERTDPFVYRVGEQAIPLRDYDMTSFKDIYESPSYETLKKRVQRLAARKRRWSLARQKAEAEQARQMEYEYRVEYDRRRWKLDESETPEL
jgi:uncharacterized protein (DUF2235 family)